jgi:hypothetical protein
MTLKTSRPHLVKHINIIDGIDDGLTAIAQPLLSVRSKPIKVILMVLLEADGHNLKPQVARTSPVVISSFDKHL